MSLGELQKSKVRGVRLLVRSIFIVLLFGCIAWLFWQDLTPLGELVKVENFDPKSEFYTDFRPGEQLDPYRREGDRVFHRIISSPVFFHIRTPRPFQSVKIEIEYRLEGERDVKFGGQTGSELYEFDYRDLDLVGDNEWHTASVDFDLGKLRYNPAEYRYQFSFQTNGPIDISRVKAHFIKSPITIERIFSNP